MSTAHHHSRHLTLPAPPNTASESRFPVTMQKVPCEPTIWNAGPLVGTISRHNRMSYAGPRHSPYVGVPYFREDQLLDWAKVEGMGNAPSLDQLFLPDLVFVNAIAGMCRVQAPTSSEFPALQEHIKRGLLDIPTTDLPMIAPDGQRYFRYAAGGDAMLLEYCNSLNEEVGELLCVFVHTNNSPFTARNDKCARWGLGGYNARLSSSEGRGED